MPSRPRRYTHTPVERCPRRARCKACNAARERQRIQTLAKYHARRAFILKLLGGKCVDCGEEEGVLDVHHISQVEKAFYISRRWSAAMDKLLPELEKCILLCRMCHKVTESYGRRRPVETLEEVPF